MSKRKIALPNVTIAIAAYNEEGAICHTLKAILAQSQKTFTLKKIIVVSDGSDDQTVSQIKSLHNPLIVIKDDGQRKGKAARLNELLQLSTTPILILLDADITFAHKHVLEALIQPLIADRSVVLTSGALHYAKPNTQLQKIIAVGDDLWNKAIEKVNGSGAYYCSGCIRAMRKSFYQTLFFPPVTAEDVFPYLKMIRDKAGTFKYVSTAKVRYKIPTSLADHFSQTRRYLSAINEQSHYFDNAMLKSQFSISTQDKLKVLVLEWFKKPVHTSLYLGINILARINLWYRPFVQSATWESVNSTK